MRECVAIKFWSKTLQITARLVVEWSWLEQYHIQLHTVTADNPKNASLYPLSFNSFTSSSSDGHAVIYSIVHSTMRFIVCVLFYILIVSRNVGLNITLLQTWTSVLARRVRMVHRVWMVSTATRVSVRQVSQATYFRHVCCCFCCQ